MNRLLTALAIAIALAGCGAGDEQAAGKTAATSDNAAPTAAEAGAFVAGAEEELRTFSQYQARVSWVRSTYITEDTDWLLARANAGATGMQVRMANEAARFAGVPGLSYDTQRKLALLRSTIELPAPSTPGAGEKLATLTTRMSSLYSQGKGTRGGEEKPGVELEALMGTERDPARLQEMWSSWHAVARPMRADYVRAVELLNAGARELGYADTGAMWRSSYDMSPADMEKTADVLWGEIKPLYDNLHCYTRRKLHEKYGGAVQPASGPIRADLLGNMWAQDWKEIYDIAAPAGEGAIGYELGDLLQNAGYDATQVVHTGEDFFTSLGFAPLPATFWARSQIVKPEGREVVCHASAWSLDGEDDLRLKMCTLINTTDFVTVHHELGHNFYQRAYKVQPHLYRQSANQGFHEALGNIIALSVTPEYLVQIGLLDAAAVPDASRDIGLLLRQALEQVPAVPWTLMVDKWRWAVFDGRTPPDAYNAAWNDLRLRYMGVMPPVPRSEQDFDPGAKYHIPAGVSYARYFFAQLLQFQFYQAACSIAGWQGPLHRCSFYGNRQVGEKLQAMMVMGRSKPWPDALEAFTGSREMSGKAMVAYFAPLTTWLEEQNEGQQCGW